VLTQCPNCDTTFRVTSEILRVAQGQVCCGRCETQFDALERLLEDDEQAPEDLESADELDSDPADLQLSEPELDTDDPAELADTISQEESAVAEEWVEFEETEPENVATVSEDVDLVEQFEEETEEEIEAAVEEEPEEEEQYEDAELETEEEYEEESSAAEQFEVAQARTYDAPSRQPLRSANISANANYVPQRRSPPPSTLRRPVPEFDDTDQFELTKPPLRSPSPAVWKYLALPLALLFMIQVFNQYSPRLARNPRFGNAVTGVYDLLGMNLIPDWNLRAYDVKVYRVLGNATNGTLRVRGSVRNRAAFPQPYPLLKLVLEDRFGEAVQAREFQPTEYLPKQPPDTRMGAQQEAIVDLLIADPGSDAAGYRLDACLAGNNGSICAEDLPRISP
jgi:predicted Zn finger-like uncharacterized protein